MGSKPELRIFVVAGEPSGDAIGGRLMAALKARHDGPVVFDGIGGPQMAAQGLKSRFAYTELAVMGLVEVLPKARPLMGRMRQLARLVDATRPDALITIDAPAFAFGLVKRLTQREVPRVHYVAPTVWAWRPNRVHKFKRHFDHLLALFPFEPPYFTKVGLACDFVGHPVVEESAPGLDQAACRAALQIGGDDGTVLGVLPGSRRGELSRHLGPFGAAVGRLAAARGKVTVVIATLEHLLPEINAAAAQWSADPRVRVVVETENRYQAMAACDVALAASGTVTLDLARLGVPVVLAYKVALMTAMILRRLARVEHAALVNILTGRGVVPEFLQEACTPEALSQALLRLLDDDEERARVLQGQTEAVAMLAPPSGVPSVAAADAVLEVIGA